VTYQYDTKDRLTQEQRTLTGVTGTFTTSYVYNFKGDLTQMTYPSGRVVQYNYTTRRLLQFVWHTVVDQTPARDAEWIDPTMRRVQL